MLKRENQKEKNKWKLDKKRRLGGREKKKIKKCKKQWKKEWKRCIRKLKKSGDKIAEIYSKKSKSCDKHWSQPKFSSKSSWELILARYSEIEESRVREVGVKPPKDCFKRADSENDVLARYWRGSR